MRSRPQPHGNIAFMIKNLFLDMIIWESKVDMRDIPTDITVTPQNMKYKIGWKLFVTTGNTLNTEYPVTFVPLCMWKTLTSVREMYLFSDMNDPFV